MKRMIENIWFKILSGDARWRIEYDQLQQSKIDWIELKFKQNGPSWGSDFCSKNGQTYWYLQCFVTKVGLKPLF